MELLFTILFFGACFAAMAVGVVFSGRRLKGSCGGVAIRDAEGDELSCGACPKKEVEVCPTDNPMAQLAQLGHPTPREHR